MRSARERRIIFLAIFSGRFRAFCAHLIAIGAPLRHHTDHVSSLRKRAVVKDASKASKSGPQHVVERLSRARHRDAASSSSSFFFHSALPQTVTFESFVWISDRPRAISSSRTCVTKKNESFSWSSNWRIPARRREREAPVKEARELSRLVKRNRKKKTEDCSRGLSLAHSASPPLKRLSSTRFPPARPTSKKIKQARPPCATSRTVSGRTVPRGGARSPPPPPRRRTAAAGRRRPR